jgi:hypothetical protein
MHGENYDGGAAAGAACVPVPVPTLPGGGGRMSEE